MMSLGPGARLKTVRELFSFLLLILATAFGGITCAMAQVAAAAQDSGTASASSGDMDSIVVTAQRREQRASTSS